MKHTPTPRNDTLTTLASQIAAVIQQARSHVRQSVNQAMVHSYWEIGRLIVEHEQQGQARAAYGARQLAELSARLTDRFGKGFDTSNLRNMRRFYQAFPIRETVSPELSWSHYNALARVENSSARDWYLREAISQNWSSRALDRQISVLYYERLLSSKDKALVEAEAAQHATPQQRVSFADEDFYLDLVFYNFKLKCFLLVDMKLGKLTHQDMGQMDTYVRLYDEQIKGADDNPTIGLVLCSEKSEAVVRYSVLAEQEQLFAAKYLPYLPSESELKYELERERERALQRLAQQQGQKA